MSNKFFMFTLLLVSAVAHADRQEIRIVGSSTVFPFSAAVAEKFGQKNAEVKTPVVESTGTGGGMKLFCAGVGESTADITNASRPIKDSELEVCKSNGVTAVTEYKIGFDGIVLATSKESHLATMQVSMKQIYLALAKTIRNAKGEMAPNPNQLWSDVDASLPDDKIEVLGPPPTSGTRDAFAEIAMEQGCLAADKQMADLKKQDEKQFKAVCTMLREDGAYIDAGENDNLMVQKLRTNQNTIGIFGFSFLDQNQDTLLGLAIAKSDDKPFVTPEFEEIAAGNYPLARSLYFYVKNDHLNVVPHLQEFINEFMSKSAIGEDGYVVDKGLIPLPTNELSAEGKVISLK